MTLTLSRDTLAEARPGVRVPAYDRAALTTGVVHIGPGAFHRAHQAAYFDDLNAGDPRWGIAAIALRSAATSRALASQDNLYTLAALDAETTFRVIGTHTAFLAATEAPDRALAALTHPDVRLVTLTVTEKGYCLGPNGALDVDHPDIFRDITCPWRPTSAIGWLVEALRRRRETGTPPFHVASCDNLPGNGDALGGAVRALAAAHDHDLATWIADEVRFPNSMVDAITPATDDALIVRVAEATGLADAAPVQREAFTSWVIEATDVSGFPDLASVGAIVTSDVAGHEQAKLRLLNGAHSTLAYLGLACGHETVGDAVADPDLARTIERLMTEEIAPSLRAPAGLDLAGYAAAIRARFRNPEIRHELAQIAWDGSQKLPIRLGATIRDNLAAGRPVALLALGVAAWMRFVRRRARDGVALVDPEAETLAGVGRACRDEAAHDVALFLERTRAIAEDLAAAPPLRTALETGYDAVMAREADHPIASG